MQFSNTSNKGIQMKWHKRIALAIKIAFAIWAVWNFYNKLVKLLYNIKKVEVKKYKLDASLGFFKSVDAIVNPSNTDKK